MSERGDEVVALIRNPDHADDVMQAGAEPALVDLEHASEDEVGTGGAGFALARGIVVKDMLAKLKPGAAIEVQALPEASAGEIDYRYWRSVQFVIGEAPPGDDERRPKEWECTSQFLGDLKTQAGGYLGTALKNYSDEKYKGAIATLFTDSFPETVAKVKGNIDKIHAKLTGELDLRCALPGDEHCSIEGSARAYADQREGYIVVCPSDPAKRSERDLLNLIHEVAHITPEVMTDDFAYSWEPLIGFLPQVIALRNTALRSSSGPCTTAPTPSPCRASERRDDFATGPRTRPSRRLFRGSNEHRGTPGTSMRCTKR
jgi:hypothetical protein